MYSVEIGLLNVIIGPYQSSFLPGRGTTDNSIVLQEIVHFMRRSKNKKGLVAFKLDLEKAFDNVNWEFLQNCLHVLAFQTLPANSLCIVSLHLLFQFYGMVTSFRNLSQLMVFAKVTLSRHTSSYCVWKNFMLLSTM